MSYSTIAPQYKKIAKNQASAGEKLISLLQFKGNESILDLGCGTGNLTFELSKKTDGIVVGVDPSMEMLEQANTAYGGRIKFEKCSAEEMQYASEFDVLFCNSVFHWFKDPTLVLKKIHHALKPSGIFALQTPVKEWCNFIVDAIEKACGTAQIKDSMKHYINPWFHLNNAKEYTKLLEKNGFNVILHQDETVSTLNCNVEKIVGLFNSGPAQAYLNEKNYTIEPHEKYKSDFINVFRSVAKEKMGKNETVNIDYKRAFLIAKKCGACI